MWFDGVLKFSKGPVFIGNGRNGGAEISLPKCSIYPKVKSLVNERLEVVFWIIVHVDEPRVSFVN